MADCGQNFTKWTQNCTDGQKEWIRKKICRDCKMGACVAGDQSFWPLRITLRQRMAENAPKNVGWWPKFPKKTAPCCESKAETNSYFFADVNKNNRGEKRRNVFVCHTLIHEKNIMITGQRFADVWSFVFFSQKKAVKIIIFGVLQKSGWNFEEILENHKNSYIFLEKKSCGKVVIDTWSQCFISPFHFGPLWSILGHFLPVVSHWGSSRVTEALVHKKHCDANQFIKNINKNI